MDRSNLNNIFKRYDFSFFGISFIIFVFGIINLYSVTNNSSNPYLAGLFKTQIIWYILSLIVGFSVSLIQPKNFYRSSWAIYLFNVLLLFLVIFLGHKGMGARRWLMVGSFRLQPSELMKISLVFVLARFYTKYYPKEEMGLKKITFPFIIALIPAILISLGPDLGTGLLILLICFTIIFYRKLKWKSLSIILLGSLISGILMFNFGLKNYQKKRILTFLNPTIDTRGSGYNAIQSKIAIGSGRLFGKGWRQSSQASFNYLPENHTDFVFSIFNEEHGFFGACLLIGLYLFLLYRFIWLSMNVSRIFDSIVIIGIMSIFFWHIIINMGMVMGLVPVVGLPLPLMSYGGSSLLTFGIGCGVITSISNSRNIF